MAERSPQLGHDYGYRLYTPTSLARELGSQAAVIVGTGGVPHMVSRKLRSKNLDYGSFIDIQADRSAEGAMRSVVQSVMDIADRELYITSEAERVLSGLDEELEALIGSQVARENELDAVAMMFLKGQNNSIERAMADRILALLSQTASPPEGLEVLQRIPALERVELFTWLAPFNAEQAAKAERQALRNLGELRGPGYVVERALREEYVPDITMSDGDGYWTSREVFREALVIHPDIGHATVIGERRTITYPDENGKPVTSFISRSQSIHMGD